MDWINLTGAKKVHSLIDKMYKRKNLEMAWERVKANRGSGGVDTGKLWRLLKRQLGQQLDRLERELKPVRQHPIPKEGQTRESIVCSAYPRFMTGCASSTAQSVRAHLRCQLWISARAIDGRMPCAKSGKRYKAGRVDRGRRSPRFLRVRGITRNFSRW